MENGDSLAVDGTLDPPASTDRGGRWFGHLFASAATRLQEVAAKLKVPRLIDLCGCPT